MDKDLVRLKRACKAIEETSERMRRATIEFLWDKYVLHPSNKDKIK